MNHLLNDLPIIYDNISVDFGSFLRIKGLEKVSSFFNGFEVILLRSIISRRLFP